KLSEAFVAQVLPEARPCYAQPLQSLRQHFPDVWVVDGSRLDAVAHRLKRLRDVRACVVPGCLPAFYALYRGIARYLACAADAPAGELPRTSAALQHVPQGTLLVGDRLYGSGTFCTALSTHSIAGLWRRNGRQSWRWVRDLSTTSIAGGTASDILVEIKATGAIPTQHLRWVRWRQGRDVRELWTNVLEPSVLSVTDALRVYPWRWKVERLFFDLKAVLNLHCFYTGNPNGVAMQVYAAVLVHTAFRVAQGYVAETLEVAPEAISPAK